jgi:hypothetical protein
VQLCRARVNIVEHNYVVGGREREGGGGHRYAIPSRDMACGSL